MALSFSIETILLAQDADGVVRVGKTRVTLDKVVETFSAGKTAEEIVQQYQSLNLADVYQVIAYYLRRSAEVKTYLQQRGAQAESVVIFTSALLSKTYCCWQKAALRVSGKAR